MILSSVGAAIGTAKSGIGIAGIGIGYWYRRITVMLVLYLSVLMRSVAWVWGRIECDIT